MNIAKIKFQPSRIRRKGVRVIGSRRVLCIVPARKGSKGLINKNVLPLNETPLVVWPIRAALGSSYIDKIICSTDSDVIANIASGVGAEVPFLRPDFLSDDKAGTVGVVLHAIDYLEERGESFDYVLVLEPTSPLTESVDIDKALGNLVDSEGYAESMVGVGLCTTIHPFFSFALTNNGLIDQQVSRPRVLRRQDLPTMYFFDGSLYISSIESLKRERSFVHSRTKAFEMPKWKNVEIDDLFDFKVVEFIMKSKSDFAVTDSINHE